MTMVRLLNRTRFRLSQTALTVESIRTGQLRGLVVRSYKLAGSGRVVFLEGMQPWRRLTRNPMVLTRLSSRMQQAAQGQRMMLVSP